jgi:signal transduction histidine kinase
LTPTFPRSSDDRALTAFAQLGALRLDARRCLISFFDRRFSYLLAEATRTLSLETDTSRHHEDALWWGTRIFPKGQGICEHTVNLPAAFDDPLEGQLCGKYPGRREVTCFVIPDLGEDDRFKHRPYVTGQPNARFYAGVPIRSPAGHNIGAYCVLDDQPRPRGISKEERDFMIDMAATVMKHLEMTKAKDELRRGSRMVRGLGSFVEGRDSINDWWAIDGSEPPSTGPDAKELRDISGSPRPDLGKPKRPDLRRNPLSFEGEKARQALLDESKPPHSTMVEATTPHSLFDSSIQDPADGVRSPTTAATIETLDKVASELQEVILAPDVKSTFSRAAMIIREATEVEGATFLDASIGTFGGLVDDNDPVWSDATSPQALSGEPGELPAVTVDPVSHGRHSVSGRRGTQGGRDRKNCGILGLSMSPDTRYRACNLAVTEAFLHELLQRYPRGRIFTFDEYNTTTYLTSEEPFSAGSPVVSPAINVVHADAQRLRQSFPHAHALAFCPLWDSHRMRWFAASIIWSSDPMRIFNTDAELSYLSAFGNSVMADVARLDAKMADRVKGDFISSISHELRSPLHGILGSVELLREMELGKSEEALVGTVEVCGRTLLDTIEHVLDFAKINKLTKPSPKDTMLDSNDITPSEADSTSIENNPLMGLTTDCDLSLLAEEVIETVYAGYGFKKPNIQSEPIDVSTSKEAGQRILVNSGKGVCVVVDIMRSTNWVFTTQPGAWRRIFMNLFGNALKYTKEGFVRVRLQARTISPSGEPESGSFSPISPVISRSSSILTESQPDQLDGRPAESEVILTITDSGKGMSSSYQRERLFHAFAQEDPLAPGTGLGLSITRQLLQDLGGQIDIVSERGRGTEINVVCRLPHAHTPSPTLPAAHDKIDMDDIRTRARGTSTCFVGFDFDGDQNPTFAHHALLDKQVPMTPLIGPSASTNSKVSPQNLIKASLRRLFAHWIGTTVLHTPVRAWDIPTASLFVVPSSAIDQVTSLPSNSAVLIVCSAADRARVSRTVETFGVDRIIEVVAQPCGPRKIGVAVSNCLQRIEERQNTLAIPDPKITNALDRCFSVDSGLSNAMITNMALRPNLAHVLGSSDSESTMSPESPLSPVDLNLSLVEKTREVPNVLVKDLGNAEDISIEAVIGAEPEPARLRVLCVDDNSVNLHVSILFPGQALSLCPNANHHDLIAARCIYEEGPVRL